METSTTKNLTTDNGDLDGFPLIKTTSNRGCWLLVFVRLFEGYCATAIVRASFQRHPDAGIRVVRLRRCRPLPQ